MNLSVGTSGFAYKEWKGPFYPKALKAADMLGYYAERFRAVEINNSFYRMPTPAALEAWAAEVPGEFTFAIKAPQRITHFQRLKPEAGDTLAELIAIAGTLKKRLGPLLFQLPPNFKKDLPRLRDFLALLPGKTRAAFEFRHQSWFDEETFDLLRECNIALCIAEDDGDLEVPFIPTADWGYLRLRKADYADAALRTWVKRIRRQDWREAFIFFKHEDEAKGPRFAQRFLELDQ